MNGVHDMGGMDGFGKVEAEQNEPPFHETWEGRVLAMQRAMGYAGAWHIDDSRYAQETLPPQTHNIIVCTLCSCYPWEMLGLPPVWYKAAPYRSRAVSDPRGVLADFGVTLPRDTAVRVWDSTAETRFIVLPMRPAGTEGWSEERLAQLVTRDSMIGTSFAKKPEEVA